MRHVPLTTDADGTIRISGSRVPLDSVVSQFKQGATAEQIQEVLSLTFYRRNLGINESTLVWIRRPNG
jgi:hypothetical protein